MRQLFWHPFTAEFLISHFIVIHIDQFKRMHYSICRIQIWESYYLELYKAVHGNNKTRKESGKILYWNNLSHCPI